MEFSSTSIVMSASTLNRLQSSSFDLQSAEWSLEIVYTLQVQFNAARPWTEHVLCAGLASVEMSQKSRVNAKHMAIIATTGQNARQAAEPAACRPRLA